MYKIGGRLVEIKKTILEWSIPPFGTNLKIDRKVVAALLIACGCSKIGAIWYRWRISLNVSIDQLRKISTILLSNLVIEYFLCFSFYSFSCDGNSRERWTREIRRNGKIQKRHLQCMGQTIKSIKILMMLHFFHFFPLFGDHFFIFT